jgi:hypothetical protein
MTAIGVFVPDTALSAVGDLIGCEQIAFQVMDARREWTEDAKSRSHAICVGARCQRCEGARPPINATIAS